MSTPTMGTVGHAKFIPAYLQLVFHYRVPATLPRLDQAAWEARGLDSAAARMAVEAVNQIEESGVLLLDGMLGLPLEQSEDRIEQAKRAFDALPPGLTHFIIHPAKDSPSRAP
jgi:chitin disaccharide deacetylase